MKLKPLFSAIFLVLGTFATFPLVPSVRAAVEISFDYFQDFLTPYGEWVHVDGYGAAWHPVNVGYEWAPYQDGAWVYTDVGWTWTSEEPWADVTYHYGRWLYADNYGWCWVPGYEWAPAWVSWRSSDNYVGWAPLPPEAEWRPSIGFSVWTDSYYDIGPRYFRFCHIRDFCEPNVRRYCRPWQENVSLMSLTFNITNINYDYDNRRIFCGGPQLGYLRGRTTSPVRHLRYVEDDYIRRSQIQGDEFRFARAVRAEDPKRGREQIQDRITRTVSRDQVDHGWRRAGGDDNVRNNLRERVRDQVRGLTPENKKAVVLAKSEGGLPRSELLTKTESNDRRLLERNRAGDRDPSGDVRRALPLRPGEEPLRLLDDRVGQGNREKNRLFIPGAEDRENPVFGNEPDRGRSKSVDPRVPAGGDVRTAKPVVPQLNTQRDPVKKDQRSDDHPELLRGKPMPPTVRRVEDAPPAGNRQRDEGISAPPVKKVTPTRISPTAKPEKQKSAERTHAPMMIKPAEPRRLEASSSPRGAKPKITSKPVQHSPQQVRRPQDSSSSSKAQKPQPLQSPVKPRKANGSERDLHDKKDKDKR